MLEKLRKKNKLNWNLRKREETSNHQKFFTSTKCLSRWWASAATAALLVGVYVVYLDLPKKFKFEPLMLFGLCLVAASFALLMLLSLQQRKNLKGIPVDVQTDLKHYEITKIIDQGAAQMGLSELAVKYPMRTTLNPFVTDWPIRQMAKEQGIEYAVGLVFGIRKDGTFFFIHNNEREAVEESS
jgi:hypothetical protein